MPLLEGIHGPQDLRPLTHAQLNELATEIRGFLIKHVSKSGGHLGPNLGVVELTLAIHRVFNSPSDPVIFDTGHQCYVHKVLTGRAGGFDTLRQPDGLSGYPSREESEHDWVENSHASTSLSWAEGIAKARQLRHQAGSVVAVIGDGALTGGMAWEALNQIAVQDELPLVIVVNDNGRSYTPTVGGLATHLQEFRTDRRYEQTLKTIREGVKSTPVVGGPLYDIMHGLKAGVKDVIAPQGLFSDLGIKYIGPIQGHDVAALESALTAAKNFGGPVIVHVITEKGKGFAPAEANERDRFHAVSRIDKVTGKPLSKQDGLSWTSVFSEQLVEIGRRRDDVVAITAAMLHPTGLGAFASAFPRRVFDVGIAEQHAVTFAAGLARGGLHPVVALYATFLNRAFDQVLFDVALHQLGVTFVLDRAGITGPDGPSHHGMWDTSFLGLVPGLRLAAPRDEQRLRDALDQAVSVQDAPTVIRYNKEVVPDPIPAVRTVGDVDVVYEAEGAKVLVVAHGPFVETALEMARQNPALPVTVVDPVWSLPVSADLVNLCSSYQAVVSMEDGLAVGGLGARLSSELRAQGIWIPVRELGVPSDFVTHGTRNGILDTFGLTVNGLRSSVESLLV